MKSVPVKIKVWIHLFLIPLFYFIWFHSFFREPAAYGYVSDFPKDQYPVHFATGPAHKVKIISIFISINQPKSCQQINIKVTLYKTFNPSRLYNFNKVSV